MAYGLHNVWGYNWEEFFAVPLLFSRSADNY